MSAVGSTVILAVTRASQSADRRHTMEGGEGKKSLRAKNEEICSALELDKDTAERAWSLFSSLNDTYTLAVSSRVPQYLSTSVHNRYYTVFSNVKGQPVHWIGLSIYAESIQNTGKFKKEKIDAALEGNRISFTKVLRLCDLRYPIHYSVYTMHYTLHVSYYILCQRQRFLRQSEELDGNEFGARMFQEICRQGRKEFPSHRRPFQKVAQDLLSYFPIYRRRQDDQKRKENQVFILFY